MTRHGRTWGLRGQTSIVKVSIQRGGYNVLSAVTVEGEMDYSIKDGTINGERYIEFLEQLISNRSRPLILLVDHATFHDSKQVREFVRTHRSQLRVFFLPKWAPEFNPDEQVWNEIKNNRIGKQAVKNKEDLKERLVSALDSLKKIPSVSSRFFSLPDTQYAGANVS
jgi:transposase